MNLSAYESLLLARTPDENKTNVRVFDICIASDSADATQMKVKEALDIFHREVIERIGNSGVWGGKVRILVGDDVPVCPCCGTTA